MSTYSDLNAFKAENAVRTFDEFYMVKSSIHEPYMCFSTTMRLSDNLVAAVSINKYYYHFQFFDVWDHKLSNVMFTNNDPEGYIQFLDNTKLFEDDCLTMLSSVDDITDEILEKYNLTIDNVMVLYKLHHELLNILKKDETIINSVL